MPGAAVFTPGPILAFVKFRSQSFYYFLGTCVTAPKPSSEKYEIPVMNDLSGRSARFQSIQDGEEGKVFLSLNRFDLNVCRSIRALGSGLASGGISGPQPIESLGSETAYARGTLVIGVSDFQLALVNSYAGLPASGQPNVGSLDMFSARGWQSCSCMNYEESTEENRVLVVMMAIQCRNVFDPVGRGFSLYGEGAIAPLGPIT